MSLIKSVGQNYELFDAYPGIHSDNGLYLYEGISDFYIIHGAVENAMAGLI